MQGKARIFRDGALACLVAAVVGQAAGAGYELRQAFVRAGVQPLAAPVVATDGNFYGTTVAGGASDGGTVFRLTPGGVLTTLVALGGPAGSGPTAALVSGPDGALYGTASSGGAGGFGTVFRVTTAGALTTLVSFTGTAGAAHGAVPQGLVLHTDGNFYGVTAAGGVSGAGTVFKMTPAGVLTTLVEFTGTAGASKGAEPVGALVFTGSTLHGVTTRGGAGNFGTIFRVTTAGVFTLAAEFTGTSGNRLGANPSGGLTLHPDGALYGTTEFGGASGFGTAFKVTTAGAFTSLRSFSDATGSQPAGALAVAADGALLGATTAGGTDGWGTLFRLTTAGAHSVLANFSGLSGATLGSAPRGGLVARGDGTFLGTTSAGGPGEMGTVFSTTAAGVVSTLAGLSLPLGWSPSGAPVADGAGNFLVPVASGGSAGGGALVAVPAAAGAASPIPLGGTRGDAPVGAVLRVGADFVGVAAAGGSSARGAAYKYSPAAGAASLLGNLSLSAGGLADGPLVLGTDGAFYGVGREGGTSGRGTVFKVTSAGAQVRVVSFTGTAGTARGARPRGPLALAGVNFLGLTEQGGTANAGTLFRLTPAGILTTLADFTATGPRAPRSGLVPAADGKLYGTTSLGGAQDAGTLLRVDPATGSWQTVAEFTLALGSAPAGPLAAGSDGTLYGLTTAGGAAGFGTVFRWAPSTGLEALVSFTGASGAAPGAAEWNPGDGERLVGGVTLAADGSLWGSAAAGGPDGGGVVFRVTGLTSSTPLEAWKQAELGDATAPDAGDPDGDGVPTLLEYALRLRPAVPDVASLPAGARKNYPDGERLSVVVPRDAGRPDIDVRVEASATLAGPWETLAQSLRGAPFTGPGYAGGDSDTPGLHQVEIRDTVTLTGAPRRFLRISITR